MNSTPSLDSTQYTLASILKYERIYGHNFISPGGLESTREMVSRLGLRPGMRVLDVGSGMGGAAFYMAETFGVQVHGVDFSRNMVTLAEERLLELALGTRVTFAYGDILETDFHEAFDLVYSRDAFLHIHDKPRLFHILYRALKAQGQVFFTDYCRGDGEMSETFRAYVAERGYDLHTPRGYGNLLEQAGFTDVAALDKSKAFGDILRQELARVPEEASMTEIRTSWEEKLARNARGEQRWGWFWARKP